MLLKLYDAATGAVVYTDEINTLDSVGISQQESTSYPWSFDFDTRKLPAPQPYVAVPDGDQTKQGNSSWTVSVQPRWVPSVTQGVLFNTSDLELRTI